MAHAGAAGGPPHLSPALRSEEHTSELQSLSLHDALPISVIGESVVHILLGGPIIAGRTLTRFFAVHVFLVPGILIALVGLHLFLVLRLGINEWPMPGRLVDRRTYRQR